MNTGQTTAMANASLLLRAIQLAESGKHLGCPTIERALLAEGFHDATELFRDDRLRAGLRDICRRHWGRSGKGADNDNSVVSHFDLNDDSHNAGEAPTSDPQHGRT
jgi:hypothetical protein